MKKFKYLVLVPYNLFLLFIICVSHMYKSENDKKFKTLNILIGYLLCVEKKEGRLVGGGERELGLRGRTEL